MRIDIRVTHENAAATGGLSIPDPVAAELVAKSGSDAAASRLVAEAATNGCAVERIVAAVTAAIAVESTPPSPAVIEAPFDERHDGKHDDIDHGVVTTKPKKHK